MDPSAVTPWVIVAAPMGTIAWNFAFTAPMLSGLLGARVDAGSTAGRRRVDGGSPALGRGAAHRQGALNTAAILPDERDAASACQQIHQLSNIANMLKPID